MVLTGASAVSSARLKALRAELAALAVISPGNSGGFATVLPTEPMAVGRWALGVADINWAVVSSGLDFLESAVDHLAKGDERDLRYGALHVTAAIEVLLKAQLAREHWTLVVSDVNRARRAEYETGNFHSVTIAVALEQLRNRVAHFALHGENPRRTEAVVAGGLDVLLHLIDREFLPDADTAERELVENTLDLVRVRLGTIAVLIRERMSSLKPELDSAPYPVLTCPGCSQSAYVLGDGEPGRCAYCLHHPFGEAAADEYVSSVLRLNSYEVSKDGESWPVHNCLNCSAEAFVAGVLPVDGTGDDRTVYACFACGYSCTDGDVDQCHRCGVLTYRPEDGLAVCAECTAAWMAD